MSDELGSSEQHALLGRPDGISRVSVANTASVDPVTLVALLNATRQTGSKLQALTVGA
jgi:hypothetical protein